MSSFKGVSSLDVLENHRKFAEKLMASEVLKYLK